LTIAILAVLAKSLVYGIGVEKGIGFLFAESNVIGYVIHPIFGSLFLLVAALMLFSTQIGVLESSSRIISENVLLTVYKKGERFNLSKAFYYALWGQIGLGIIMLLAGIKEPRMLLTTSAVLNAVSMMVSFPLIYILNKKFLRKEYQPNRWRILTIMSAFLFFVIFVIITFKVNIFA
jgi:hypothetical protein